MAHAIVSANSAAESSLYTTSAAMTASNGGRLLSHDAWPHGSSCTLHTCDIPLSRTLASSNCITLAGSVRKQAACGDGGRLRVGMGRPPADVGEQNVSCAHARRSEAFEAETSAKQQDALAEHPVRLIHKQLR
jgi:hypothetical protein